MLVPLRVAARFVVGLSQLPRAVTLVVVESGLAVQFVVQLELLGRSVVPAGQLEPGKAWVLHDKFEAQPR